MDSVKPKAIAIAGHVLRMTPDERRDLASAKGAMDSRIATSTVLPGNSVRAHTVTGQTLHARKRRF